MKTKWHFTRGETAAGLLILALMMGSYLFYYLYDGHRPGALCDESRAAEFAVFVESQRQLQDSIEQLRHAGRRNSYAYERRGNGTDTVKKRARMYDIVRLDLNHCDTDDVKSVPQFGSKRAAALIKYRDKLGGFYALSQCKEVYILQSIDEELLDTYFFVTPSAVKKIRINSATYAEMASHPYFDAYLTKTILNYRNKNGPITSPEQLQQITHAYPELMERLRHYVSYETTPPSSVP